MQLANGLRRFRRSNSAGAVETKESCQLEQAFAEFQEAKQRVQKESEELSQLFTDALLELQGLGPMVTPSNGGAPSVRERLYAHLELAAGDCATSAPEFECPVVTAVKAFFKEGGKEGGH